MLKFCMVNRFGIDYPQKRPRLGIKIGLPKGRGGGKVVSVHTFNSDDPSSNPAETYCLSVKFVY